MREGFEYVSFTNSLYGGIKKIIDVPDVSNGSSIRGMDPPPDCLVFIKHTMFFSGKFKTNPINYIFPFFPAYIEYMLQIAPYFFIHEEYLEKLEKYQPVYDISSAFDFYKKKRW